MTRLLVDSSVLIKWFHGEGESEIPEARALRAAHARHDVGAHMLDLALYEIGNVLLRALSWKAEDVADQLDDLQAILGPPLVMSAEMLRRAAMLAEIHALTFYDASWAAAASELAVTLVSADRRLLAVGLGESPAQVCKRLQLSL